MATLREQIVAAARALLGTPFHHQGRVPGVGLDCAGVPIVVAWQLGLMPRAWNVDGYPAAPDGSALQAYCAAHMRPVSQAAMQPGDAILVAWQAGPPQHLGLVVPHRAGALSMVHALGPRAPAKVVETRLLFGRAMRFVAAYALPGVE